ncbi:MAG: NAD(P)H-dependent oxidoreductase [Ruminococcus sp.]|nr:NAD(P)H-dependent oxidoreductase [Ruminococcus sp.]
MKRLIGIFTAVCVTLAMTACSDTQNPTAGGGSETFSQPSAEIRTEYSETTAEEVRGNETAVTEKNGTNILIAYFTWAENTSVADPSSVDTDATTSASVLLPGNVGLLAEWIAEETGGDRFSIIAEEPYSSDYDTCLDRAAEEHDSGSRPAITGHVENMEDYDIIFLGFPNWWYSCPMAILTFIDEHDLSGKTIIPFCSHGTGGFAASLIDIGNELPEDCTVLKEFGAYRPEVAGSREALLEWLSELNITY